MRGRILCIIGVTLLAGCSVRSIQPYFPQSITKDIHERNYFLGEERSAYIGDNLISVANLKIEEVSSGQYRALESRVAGAYSIRKDNLYSIMFLDRKDDTVYVGVGPGGIRIYEGGVLVDPHPYDFALGGWQRKLLSKVGEAGERLFVPVEKIQRVTSGSSKIELVYMGFDGINVELACREYLNDVKRPTIFQSMVYNLEKSKIIRYKNFKINVLDATEEELNYVVVED